MKRGKNTITSKRKSLQYRGTECLNCGHPLDRSDVYCPQCSQLNSNKQLSAKDFFAEFLSSILVYDSRLRNTLKDLLFRPGIMTKNYVKGRRLKYANPFRFFLSVSIIYFLLQGFLAIVQPRENGNLLGLNVKPGNEAPSDSLISELPLAILRDAYRGDTLKAKQLEISRYFSEAELDSLGFFESYRKRGSLYLEYYYRTKTADPATALDSLGHSNTFNHRWLYSRAITWNKINQNPNAFVNYVTNKIPAFLFFFTPFYAFFFWLLYSKKKYTYIEHVIFIFHIFSFVFLALLVFMVPDLLLEIDFSNLLFILLGPVYFFIALRNFYGDGWLVTFVKFVFLNFIFVVSFFVATLLFVAASAAIY